MNAELQAVDVFIRSSNIPEEGIGTKELNLKEVYCRGTLLDPKSASNCLLTDVFQCRFVSREGAENIPLGQIAELLKHLSGTGFHWVQVQNVYNF